MCIKLLNDLYKEAADAKNSCPYLVVYAEDGEQTVLLTNSGFWTIGRGGNNTIVLGDLWVSRHHATIQIVGQDISYKTASQVNQAINTTTVDRLVEQSTTIQGATMGENSQPGSAQTATQSHATRFYLADLVSRNGSLVNGNCVVVPVRLKDGDRLTIGKTEMIFYKPHQLAEASGLLSPDLQDPPTLPTQHANLTPSEEKVFKQVVQGLTNKDIGAHLQISPRTVQTHLSSIMAKLNLENRSQIVRYAFQHGFHIPEPESQ